MKYSFKTLAKSVGDVDFKEKGSKFIGFAFPVDDEEEAEEKIKKLWETHPNATHVCYAYRLGIEGETYRANDDGEPSGTAGLPIYNQILSKEITNVLVASVRYYGGTKLGVGGLVKAYKLSAQLVLEEAKIVQKHLKEKYEFEFSYEEQGLVLRNVDKFNGEIVKTTFTDVCGLIVKIKKSKEKEFLASFKPLYKVKISKLS